MEPNPYQSPQAESQSKRKQGVTILFVIEILLLILFLGTVPLLALLPLLARLLPSS